MGIPEIIQAVIEVGFPVVACCYMAKINAKQVDDFRADNKAEAEIHRKENEKLQTLISNNTAALIRLMERLGIRDDQGN